MLQQNQPPKSYSKIPRPVSSRINHEKNQSNKSKAESQRHRPLKKDEAACGYLVKEHKNDRHHHVKITAAKDTNGSGVKVSLTALQSEPVEDELFKSLAEEQGKYLKDEFQPDENALESILSNKGITPNLSANPSSSSTVQSLKRSSIYYYQSPSRMSLKDSHDLFKDKMKLLKEQMKSMNIKIQASPTHEKVKTPTSSSRPVNIYYKMKPLDKPAVSKTDVTPRESRKILKNVSLSERKEPEPRDFNSERLCNTSTKLAPTTLKHPTSLHRGKENKCRFKLFSSPIHEVPENDSTEPISNPLKKSQLPSSGIVSSDLLNSVPSLVDGNQKKELSAKDENSITPCPNTDENLQKTCILLTRQTESSSFTPLTNVSCSAVLNKCAAIATPTQCTWSVNSAICSPMSRQSKPTSQKDPSQLTTPTLQNKQIPTDKKSTPTAFTPTPSRSACKNRGLMKAPQRTPSVVTDKMALTPKGLYSIQVSERRITNAPFLCSYLKSKLESRH